jgi:hypothetical protein
LDSVLFHPWVFAGQSDISDRFLYFLRACPPDITQTLSGKGAMAFFLVTKTVKKKRNSSSPL